ncbi:MAG: response regulator [Pseudomonadota bacterium]
METRQRILVIDDEPINITILNELLESDYEIQAASGGREALESVHQNPPDLILLDIIMPDVDGYEVLRQLKNCPETADIPVIFVTIMSEIDDEKKGLDMGAVDYIVKPISPSIVAARVATHLKLKHQKDQLRSSISLLQHQTEILGHKAELGIQACSLAHDLNNVLAGAMIVELIGPMLPDTLEGKAVIEHYLKLAMENLGTGRRICQGYTDYLKDIGEKEKPQSIVPLLKPLDMYVRRFKGKIHKEIEPGIPPILCKGYQIKRVILNLFTNACQAVEAQEPQLIAIRVWSRNGKVFFSIRDNGPGIPESVLPRIFEERFTTRKTGTGLGLYLVNKIVRAHNGFIDVDPGPGRGATFTLGFPMAPGY